MQKDIDDMMNRMNLQQDGLMESHSEEIFQEALMEVSDDAYYEDVFDEDPNRNAIRKSKAQAQILLERKRNKNLLDEFKNGQHKNSWMKRN